MLNKILLISTCYFLIACAGPPPANHIRASGFSPSKILLKNSKNQFVRLASEPPYYLIADALQSSDADTFQLCNLGHDIIALKAKDQYVTVHLQLNNQAILRQKHIDHWERLTLEKHHRLASFKGCNGKYLCPSNENILAAIGSNVTTQCLFQIIELQ
ncbi:hypothetical protein [Aureispira sp. CCB-QB1]|uniref:fascin domain-containing protein n=1 Tax=Aureispira sp. CCB-QB1 TaxID=1313421 RepID=UPI000697DA84|nr:hypothetical protein [Aureispira sp. CCB-QB1]